ncbi:hypothetical protein NQD34_015252 [Periophthalmus magnuspinnatus]|nr:hypothetical protein NQD34_015252 [Periophthalmus magnuspinnatus]
MPFEVTVQNEHRGNNKAVSYTKTVTLTIYGSTLTISREYPNKILVVAVVETAAITLTFDWHNSVSVTLPQQLPKAVCGQCNFNGRGEDI